MQNPTFPGVTHLRAPARSASSDSAEISSLVTGILSDVCTRGDGAVAEYAARFDKSLRTAFEVSDAERAAALEALDPQTRADTEFAIANVRRFAQAQLATIAPLEVEILPGVHLGTG